MHIHKLSTDLQPKVFPTKWCVFSKAILINDSKSNYFTLIDLIAKNELSIIQVLEYDRRKQSKPKPAK